MGGYGIICKYPTPSAPPFNSPMDLLQMFRLLLEYARLTAVDRHAMSYHGSEHVASDMIM